MGIQEQYDIVVIGGSFAGLAAALALARSRRKVLVIDDGKPCNEQVSHAHNLLAHDGQSPDGIRRQASLQLKNYPEVYTHHGTAEKIEKEQEGFRVTCTADNYFGKKILLATGLYDQLPSLAGLRSCWGKSVYSCPYCDAYEIKDQFLGVLGNGNEAFEMCLLLYNWSQNLCIFSNGTARFTNKQRRLLEMRSIRLVEDRLSHAEQINGQLKGLVSGRGVFHAIGHLFLKPKSVQKGDLHLQLNCQLKGKLLKVDKFLETSIPGVYAAGDNCSVYRAISVAIANGTRVGSFINRKLLAAELSAMNSD